MPKQIQKRRQRVLEKAAAVTDLRVHAGRVRQGSLGLSMVTLQPPLSPNSACEPAQCLKGKGTKELPSQRTVEGSFVLPNWPPTRFAPTPGTSTGRAGRRRCPGDMSLQIPLPHHTFPWGCISPHQASNGALIRGLGGQGFRKDTRTVGEKE